MQLELDLQNKKRLIKEVKVSYYETFDEDGWLHTGALAEIDTEGFVKIIGRKKEILITSAGKNIAPVEVEDLIKPHLSLIHISEPTRPY